MPATRILIVEDDGETAFHLRMTLEQFGYEVLAVIASGSAAIQTAQELQPDLILMDIQLRGDMDGVEAANRIHAQLDVPIVYLTAYASEPLLQRAKLTHPFGYLLKPFHDRELRNTIEITLCHHAQEQRVRASEQTVQALLNATLDVALLVNTEGIILAANHAMARRVGKPLDDIIGACAYDLLPEQVANVRRAKAAEVIRSGQPLLYEEQHPLSGVITHNSIYPVFDAGGNVERLTIFAQDITERKRTEEQLRKLSVAIEQSPSIAVITDLQGNIEYVNPKFTEITGYRTEEVIGCNPRILKSNKHSTTFYRDLWRTIWNGNVWRGEFYNKKKDGDLYWEAASISCIRDASGHISHFLKVAEDITSRKQAEQELYQAKERAEAANRAKSEFLANMSHELRTPLNGILGYTQILKRDAVLNTQQRQAVETIHNSGEHLLMLINDILDLSKIEAGKIEIEPTTVRLAAFLKTIVDIMRIRAAHQKIRFVYKRASRLPEVVRCDEKRLRQVLLNLLGNAVKFTPRGQVTLRVSEIPSSSPTSAPNTQVCFEIEDTGIGIPADQLQKIFHPFHQLRDHQIQSEGTGLGLSISRRLVRMMGGELYVNSTPGQGSTFWFDLVLPTIDHREPLPAEAQPSPEEQPEANCSPERFQHIAGFQGPTRSILIAEDAADNRAMLKNMLLPLGFEVAEAVDGKEAVDKTLDMQPDVILLDLVMPGLDGLQTVRRIRSRPELRNTVIFMLTANAFEQSRRDSLNAGCDDFLVKPVCLEHLLEKLSVHLHLEWVSSPSAPVTSAESVADETLILPPEQALKRLLEMARDGDVMAIRQQLGRLERTDSRFSGFTGNIRQLAQGFQLGEICRVLEQALAGDQ